MDEKNWFLSTWVFNRVWESNISNNKFYGIISACLAWWFWLTAFFANKAIENWYSPDNILLFIIWIITPFLWILLSIKSKNPFLSFIWYNMIVIPFWYLLWPVINQYSEDIVQNAMIATAWVSILMWIRWTISPNFFSKIWNALFISLLCLVIIWIFQLFIPSLNLMLFDYIWAWIFSLYIWYDMYRANSIQKTVDNAVDLCVDFYLDIINLFLKLLRIFWRRRR